MTSPTYLADPADDEGLDLARERIDALDSRLLTLLNRRAALSLEIAVSKAELGRDRYDPAREQAILARLAARNEGPLRSNDIERIYGALFESMRALPLPTGARVSKSDDIPTTTNGR